LFVVKNYSLGLLQEHFPTSSLMNPDYTKLFETLPTQICRPNLPAQKCEQTFRLKPESSATYQANPPNKSTTPIHSQSVSPGAFIFPNQQKFRILGPVVSSHQHNLLS